MLEHWQPVWDLLKFILELLIKYLLCVRHYARYQGYDGEQNRTQPFPQLKFNKTYRIQVEPNWIWSKYSCTNFFFFFFGVSIDT